MYSCYRISEMQVILRGQHTDNIAEKNDRRTINQNISHHEVIYSTKRN